MKKIREEIFFPHLAEEDAFPSAFHLDCKSNLLLKIDAVYDFKKKTENQTEEKMHLVIKILHKIENQSDKKS